MGHTGIENIVLSSVALTQDQSLNKRHSRLHKLHMPTG